MNVKVPFLLVGFFFGIASPVCGWGGEAHPDTAIAGVFSNYLLGVEPFASRLRPGRGR